MATEDRTGEDIEGLAEQAARELLEAMPSLKSATPIERGMAISEALRAEQGSAARLLAVLSGDLSFGDLRSGWIQQRGGYGMVVQGHVLPHVLISRFIDGHSVGMVIEEARAFAGSRTSRTESYMPLAGATVGQAVSLGDKIDLIPWVDVPDGNHKRLFFPELSMSITHMRAMPNSALRTRSTECQVLFSSHEESEGATEVSDSESATRSEQSQDILRCITVISVRPVAVLGSWMQFDKRIANDIGGAGYSYSGAFFDNAVITASFNPVVLDGGSIARLLGLFEVFEPSEKKVMRVALDRLNQALRRQSTVDKAIDLGIALEVMLLHEIGKKERGELRFRSSIRGAAFLGGDKPERLKILRLLKDAYDLRSLAVHAGILEEGSKGPSSKQILDDATSAAARIARKLIERGSFPDWDAEYVIGGQ